MGKFEDLIELLEGLEGKKVEIEMVTDVDDLIDKLEEIMDKKDEMPDELKEIRDKAIQATKDSIKERGEETTRKATEYAAVCAMLMFMLEQDMPLEYEEVVRYNTMLRELYPENCKKELVEDIYEKVRKKNEEGMKELGF